MTQIIHCGQCAKIMDIDEAVKAGWTITLAHSWEEMVASIRAGIAKSL